MEVTQPWPSPASSPAVMTQEAPSILLSAVWWESGPSWGCGQGCHTALPTTWGLREASLVSPASLPLPHRLQPVAFA